MLRQAQLELLKTCYVCLKSFGNTLRGCIQVDKQTTVAGVFFTLILLKTTFSESKGSHEKRLFYY